MVNRIFISPGALLWKIEQKSNRAFACGKVTIKGKRHWYEALPQAVFVALSDDTAWIIRTNGDLYLQTGNCSLLPLALLVTRLALSQCIRGKNQFKLKYFWKESICHWNILAVSFY